MAPKPPAFGAPRPSRGAPLVLARFGRPHMGAPKWPPSPQPSERPGTAVACLFNRWGSGLRGDGVGGDGAGRLDACEVRVEGEEGERVRHTGQVVRHRPVAAG